jgi:multidrug efflux pump subunit AcrA (membrane-fusion protein)
LTASVTLYKGNAKDALIIPVSALRDLGDGKYGVFTIEKDNSMKLNFVEVGLKDSTNAEILSGWNWVKQFPPGSRSNSHGTQENYRNYQS